MGHAIVMPALSPLVPDPDRDTVTSHLSIGCFASICRDRLADQLVAFSDRFPEVGVGIHEMPRAALVQSLEAGDVTLAIAPDASCDRFGAMRLWSDQIIVALPRTHRLAGLSAIDPVQLADELFLVSRFQHGWDMHRFLAERVLPGRRPATGLHDVEQKRLMTLVAQERGVALLCRSHIGHDYPGVVLLPVEGGEARFHVHACWRRDLVDPIVDALIEAFDLDAES